MAPKIPKCDFEIIFYHGSLFIGFRVTVYRYKYVFFIAPQANKYLCFFSGVSAYYSLLKLFTGLANAAFMA